MKGLLRKALYPHQQKALDFHLKAKYSICGFQVGLGKTCVALAFCESVGKTALVVSPAYLVKHWEDEIEDFTYNQCKYAVISYSKLKNVKSKKYDVIIFDEIHYLKNIKAQRTNLAHSIVSNIRPRYLLGLSGTPIKNNVFEWWSLIKLCTYGNESIEFKKYEYLPDFFASTFSYVKEFRINGYKIKRYEGIRNTEELKKILKPMYHRRKAEGLPPQTNKFVEIQTGNTSAEKFQQELESAFKEANCFSTVKLQNAISKAPYTIEYVKDLIAQGAKVIVFTDHVDSAHVIAKKLKAKPLTGATPIRERVQEVSSMQNGFRDVLVCTIGSMSTGFNITASNHVVFNDLPWTSTDLAQAKGRIRRITQDKTCHYHYMFSGKVDKKIYDTLAAKIKILREAT